MDKKSDRWRCYLHEHVGDVIIALSVILILLATGRAHQKWSTISELSHIKTTVDLASVVLSIVIGTIAAIAGFRRFFKGRTFSERATLEISSNPVCELQIDDLEHLDGDFEEKHLNDDFILHAVNVCIVNVGSMTIWTPNMQVRARYLESEVEFPKYGKSDKIESTAAPLSISGVEPGETIYYHYRFLIPKMIPAFRVSAELNTSRSNIWHKAMTLSNTI